MKYIVNHAGNRIVEATPEEIHALRPSIAACLRSRRLSDEDIEDFCQEVEIVAWRAIAEQRIVGNEFARPVDALLNFMLSVAWNLWRNHSRKRWVWCEELVDELPDMAGPSPEGRLDARETLLRLAIRPDIARFLLLSLNGRRPELREGMPRATFWGHVAKARTWAREVDAGHWQAPKQPVPLTPWHRKKKR